MLKLLWPFNIAHEMISIIKKEFPFVNASMLESFNDLYSKEVPRLNVLGIDWTCSEPNRQPQHFNVMQDIAMNVY